MARRTQPPNPGWPVLLVVGLGAVLVVERLTPLGLSEWVLVALRMTFAVAIAAAVIAGFMRLVIWWFWSRHR